MTIFAIADKNPRIDILDTIQSTSADVVVTLGDLTREDLLPLERATSLPKIGVYGNHDSGTYMDELGIWDMHLKTWNFGGLKWGGFQGCVRYKDNPQAIMCTQEEAEQWMRGFPPVDVFLSHCPPYGINDEPEDTTHQGFKVLRSYLETHKPMVWMHGHTYPPADVEIKKFGDTRIEYVSGYKIIYL